MLKIEAKPLRIVFLLAFGPLLAVASLLAVIFSVLLIAYSNMYMEALISLSGPSIFLCHVIHNGWKNTFHSEVTLAMVANSRTVAFVPYSGPVRYVNRRDCRTAFGNWVQLNEGKQVRLGWVEFGSPRLRKDFLLPLYSQWCPSYTREEIERHLTPWVARQDMPLLVGLPITLAIVLVGLALTDWNIAILLLLTSVPLLIAGLMMWHAIRVEVSGPPVPERLCIAQPELTPFEADLDAEYAQVCRIES